MDTAIVNEYWLVGLATLPTKQNKAPHNVSTWKGGVKDVKAYEDAFGVGILCGSISGNLECLDFDNHFGDAKGNMSAFIEEIKALYEKHKFPIQSTQGGGFHLLYRCDEIQGNQKLAQKPKYNDTSKRFEPDAIIETRGEGGYFCAAPTEGYNIVRNDIFNIPTITPAERCSIIEVAKSFNEWHELKVYEDEDNGRPGDKFNQDPSSIEHVRTSLLQKGWSETRNGQWRRPSKKDGISATLGKAASNVFYVFSSNAYPFEPMKGYSPFQVVSLLDYNGDFKQFARELAERYNIDKPAKREYASKKETIKEVSELEKILKGSFIDFAIPVVRPPIAMKIQDFENGSVWSKRLFTLGNFSAITGKSKSKKTFLTSILLAAAAKNGVIQKKVTGCLPESKGFVLLFDTEQSNYDAYMTANRVNRIAGYECENYGAFDLREFSPAERCQIIEFALEKYKDNLGYVVIDGIADLASAINDEIEATRVVSLLMRWTKVYNCHITVVIHQNKNDNFATGHLGSSIIKKAECVISVTKKEGSPVSEIKCDMIRGTSDFNDFEMYVDENGLPCIDDMENLASHYEVKDIPF